MKILYNLARTFNSGGMERIVIAKANWLAKHGHKVTIVTTEQDGQGDFFPLEKNVSRIDLDIFYSKTLHLNPLKKYIVRRKLLRQHKKTLERVIHNIKPDVIVSTFGNEVEILPKIKYYCPRIAEIHFSRWYRLQGGKKGIWFLINKYLTYQDKKNLTKYDKFICLTEEDKLHWDNQVNLEVIPNFITSKAIVPSSLNHKSMIAVGRLSYQKGYDRMIKAWEIVVRKHPDWVLNIFGGGELKEDLEKLICEKNMQGKIVLHEPSHNIENEYLNNSALVMSSHFEGLPMVLLEGISAGLPIVSFACKCGPRDVVRQNETGILVEEGDIIGLAEAITTLIENQGIRKEMGKKAYEDADNYLEEPIMRRWMDLFEEVTAQK